LKSKYLIFLIVFVSSFAYPLTTSSSLDKTKILQIIEKSSRLKNKHSAQRKKVKRYVASLKKKKGPSMLPSSKDNNDILLNLVRSSAGKSYIVPKVLSFKVLPSIPPYPLEKKNSLENRFLKHQNNKILSKL